MIYKAPTSIKNPGALRGGGHSLGSLKIMCFRCRRNVRSDEELQILAGNKFQIFGVIFEMHASKMQGCIVEHRDEQKRKITESVWVHNVVTVQTGKVAGQCAMPYTPRWPV